MNERRILIVDNDQKNLQVLESHLIESDYHVETATSDDEALKLLARFQFNIVLTELSRLGIDGYRILKEIQRDSNRNSIPVIFLSSKSDVWNRVKSLKLGAKDYIVKPIHVREIVARLNMVYNRYAAQKKSLSLESHKFSGRLEDLSVIDLIEIFGIEKKTGVLTLNNENGHSGEIIFNHGNVISASTVSLRAEEAVYKMMYWNRGRFSMLFGATDTHNEMMISNMGLLLQGAKRMDLRNELLKQLPSLDAVVITTSNFKKILSQKEMNQELKEFLKLFDGERSLGRIIDDCRENEIVTLKRIAKLYKLGFLHVLRDFSKDQHQPLQFKSDHEEELPEYVPFKDLEKNEKQAESEPEPDSDSYKAEHPPSEPEEDSMFENMDFSSDHDDWNENYEPFEPEDELDFEESTDVVSETNGPQHQNSNSTPTGNILVIGTELAYRTEYIEKLTGNSLLRAHIGSAPLSDFYQGVVKFRDGQFINVISVSTDQEFSSLIDHFESGTLGIILLVDAESSVFSYYRYLVNVLKRKTQAPISVVLKSDQNINDFELHDLHNSVGLTDEDQISVVPHYDEKNCRQALFAVLKENFRNHNLTSTPSENVK